ncbi:MAG: hypothetical protein JSV21_07405 [Nitrospirota bacterium]|nr:MAG: hypothetical protein JSV21_07405 [Nitrospirota bacterium]
MTERRAVLLTLVVILVFFGIAYAEKSDTPYGDFCPKCSKYGVCPELLSVEEAHEAVESYFREKGISVGKIRGHGRFLKMQLIKDNDILDVILFDRKTGRIRSIY